MSETPMQVDEKTANIINRDHTIESALLDYIDYPPKQTYDYWNNPREEDSDDMDIDFHDSLDSVFTPNPNPTLTLVEAESQNAPEETPEQRIERTRNALIVALVKAGVEDSDTLRLIMERANKVRQITERALVHLQLETAIGLMRDHYSNKDHKELKLNEDEEQLSDEERIYLITKAINIFDRGGHIHNQYVRTVDPFLKGNVFNEVIDFTRAMIIHGQVEVLDKGVKEYKDGHVRLDNLVNNPSAWTEIIKREVRANDDYTGYMSQQMSI